MRLDQYIDRYSKREFSVIPINRGEKTPAVAWKDFQTRKATRDELDRWFSGETNSNIGIATGTISGIVVLDVDGDEGAVSLAELGELPSTPTVRTGKGRHLYFEHPGFPVSNSVRLKPGLDIRGDGGYVVAPPSLHPNGSAYEWIVGPETQPLAKLPLSIIQLINSARDPKDNSTETKSLGLARPGAQNVSRTCRQEVDRLLGQLAQAVIGTRNDTLNRVSFAFGQMNAGGGLDCGWAKDELRKVALSIGLEATEVESTIESGFEAGTKKPKNDVHAAYEILDLAPEVMDRPLRLIDGKAYAATWLPIAPRADVDGKESQMELVIFTKDREFYCSEDIRGSRALDDLPLRIDLPYVPAPDKLMSPAGFRAFMSDASPTPLEVFSQVSECVDRFVSFESSLTDQRGMRELVACWIIGTYFLDAFDVVGYLWPTGERGSGKTQLLNTVSSLAYLGKTTTAGSSFASIRDDAHYGATLAFDDCEDLKNMENSKRELLLAGNTRGTLISRKEPTGQNGWRTVSINNFAPRLFSSIGMPDPVLGSRTISVPLITSLDTEKTRRSPVRTDDWSIDRQKIVDGLWSIGVNFLSRVRESDQEASRRSGLAARGHDIFRMPLAIAYWLQHDHNADRLWARLETLSARYRELQSEYEEPDLSTLVVLAAHDLVAEKGNDITVPTKLIANHAYSRENGYDALAMDEASSAYVQRVGQLMGRLGFDKAGHRDSRSWRLRQRKVEDVAKARGIPLSLPTKLAEVA